MNQFLKQVIEEKFVSKKQQRFFYAKANEKGASKKEKKKSQLVMVKYQLQQLELFFEKLSN